MSPQHGTAAHRGSYGAEAILFCSSYFPPTSVRQLGRQVALPGGGIGDSHAAKSRDKLRDSQSWWYIGQRPM